MPVLCCSLLIALVELVFGGVLEPLFHDVIEVLLKGFTIIYNALVDILHNGNVLREDAEVVFGLDLSRDINEDLFVGIPLIDSPKNNGYYQERQIEQISHHESVMFCHPVDRRQLCK